MNNYKEPEMEAVALENEDLDNVSGGFCSSIKKEEETVGKKCGGYFCASDSRCSPIAR